MQSETPVTRAKTQRRQGSEKEINILTLRAWRLGAIDFLFEHLKGKI
jgi:hypothetical protein